MKLVLATCFFALLMLQDVDTNNRIITIKSFFMQVSLILGKARILF